jgi:hypothetical protein
MARKISSQELRFLQHIGNDSRYDSQRAARVVEKASFEKTKRLRLEMQLAVEFGSKK